MATVHIMFIGGPFDGTMQSMDNPGDFIEFPVKSDERYVTFARYRKLRTEKPEGSPLRGEQGLWLYGDDIIEKNEGQALAIRHKKGPA